MRLVVGSVLFVDFGILNIYHKSSHVSIEYQSLMRAKQTSNCAFTMEACLSDLIEDMSCSNLAVNSCLFGLIGIRAKLLSAIFDCGASCACIMWVDCDIGRLNCGSGTVVLIGAKVTIRGLSVCMMLDVVARGFVVTLLTFKLLTTEFPCCRWSRG